MSTSTAITKYSDPFFLPDITYLFVTRGKYSRVLKRNVTQCNQHKIIAKNIRYLRWNRGAWRCFHDTYLTNQKCGYSVNQSFIWFLSINRRKSTFYSLIARPPVWNVNRCWTIVTLSIHKPPLNSVTSRWPINPTWFLKTFLITMAFFQVFQVSE